MMSSANIRDDSSLLSKVVTALRIFFGHHAQPPVPTTQEEQDDLNNIAAKALVFMLQNDFRKFENFVINHLGALQTKPAIFEDKKLGGTLMGYTQSTRLDNLLYVAAHNHASSSQPDITVDNKFRMFASFLLSLDANPNAVHGSEEQTIAQKIQAINPRTCGIINRLITDIKLGFTPE